MPTHFMTDEEILKAMGERITRHRLAQNITQEDLAVHAGVSRSSVRAIERGDAVNMAIIVKVLRSLRLLHHFFASIPEIEVDMHWFIKNQPPERKRARKEKS
ncbi:hypothetical protein A9404_04100 [Halothiobacillus diazotrophicus]|uniref:HTH cro/C1-type domain-containing protein n=2 Tax=Halothiobacillus diazotrophicus TaxID=1860122 RepID=A0A191ZFN6_9GAMM|nr:hypothetical protein A9404_04100 [Halothiobacillus diazotrophicus]